MSRCPTRGRSSSCGVLGSSGSARERSDLFRPDAICFCFVNVFRRRRKTCAGSCPITTILLFLPPTAGERNERRSGQCKGRIRKNKSAGLFQGKTACFPLWREAEQEADANHPFPQESALCRWILLTVVIRGARAANRSELSFYSDQTQILFLKSESPGSKQKKNLVGL